MFPADNWGTKAQRRRTTGTGRCRHLKTMARRFKVYNPQPSSAPFGPRWPPLAPSAPQPLCSSARLPVAPPKSSTNPFDHSSHGCLLLTPQLPQLLSPLSSPSAPSNPSAPLSPLMNPEPLPTVPEWIPRGWPGQEPEEDCRLSIFQGGFDCYTTSINLSSRKHRPLSPPQPALPP